MDISDLEAAVRRERIKVLARTPAGRERVMSIAECRRTGSAYIQLVLNEMDSLLEQELKGTVEFDECDE